MTLRTLPLTPAERTRQVEEAKIDAALLRGHVRAHAVETTHIWYGELVAAMPLTHLLANRNAVSLQELAQSPVSLADRRMNPAQHDLIEGALASRGLAVNAGIPFTTVEATFAQLATHPMAMRTPVFSGHEAEHSYAGIRTVGIDPPLTLSAFSSPRKHWHSVIVTASLRPAGSLAANDASAEYATPVK
ncbi:LysR substrate-binding domain-containing protein [Actinobaculum sp. 313]|uniref:LysR substrate-binding domain-containing protein n=1 Tax=Actinobaculum sp. 313 TaxID=2495645 RepID=UPI0013DE4FD1|nr:LysR substrate-binding domain-containing protein [Actinobaculum sp. 313]